MSSRHPFHERLNGILESAGFDEFVESACAEFQAEQSGGPSLPPGLYFRLLFLGYFEGLDSERWIAWRAWDSLSVRRFLGLGGTESAPDHSMISRTRRRIDVETHARVFEWVRARLEESGLVSGKTLGVDASTPEADAALRSIVRRDTGEDLEEFVRGLAEAPGVATPTRRSFSVFDRKRKKTLSNEEREKPRDPESEDHEAEGSSRRMATRFSSRPAVPESTLDSESLLRRLVAEQRLDLTRGSLFEQPAPFPAGEAGWARVRGMMLGLAIGDALGNTTEGRLPEDRCRQYGEIRDYLRNRYADNRAVGVPSDDTQLAFWTLEHLVHYRTLIPEALARTFASRQIFGIGGSVKFFIGGMKQGKPWWCAAAPSAGNGALMRIAPVTIPHLRMADQAFWSDAALCAAITHNDRGSIGACVAMAGMLGELLSCRQAPASEWWVTRYVELARQVEGESSYIPRGGLCKDEFCGPIWRFVEKYVPPAVERGKSVVQVGSELYSGAYLLETAPMVLFILSRYGHDPEEAIVRAVNDTRDNDTCAAIVGAAVGALHGEDALPRRWRENLLGRTAADDDGRIVELLDRAEGIFGCGDD